MIVETGFTGFGLYASYVLVFGLFFIVVAQHKYLLMRPSIWLLAFWIIILNIPAAFLNTEFYHGYSREYEFRILSIFFPAVGLIWLRITPRMNKLAFEIFSKCRIEKSGTCKFTNYDYRFVLILFTLFLIINLMVVFHLGANNLGLTAVIYDPLHSSEARKETVMLYDAPAILRYASAIARSSMAPVLICTAYLGMKKRSQIVPLGVVFVTTMVGSAITGARIPIFYNLLALGFLLLLLHSFSLRYSSLCLLVIMLGLTSAATISILREDKLEMFSIYLFLEYFWRIISWRIFEAPFLTGILTNNYTELTNVSPLSAFGNLSYWFSDQEPENLAVLAGEYSFRRQIHMNTGFLYHYQAFLGLHLGWFVSWLCLGILDLPIRLVSKLEPNLCLAIQACLLTSVISLMSSSFTTVLLTHGFLGIVTISLFAKKKSSLSHLRKS